MGVVLAWVTNTAPLAPLDVRPEPARSRVMIDTLPPAGRSGEFPGRWAPKVAGKHLPDLNGWLQSAGPLPEQNCVDGRPQIQGLTAR